MMTGADYPRMYCDTCPFNSNDPLAWYGHEARRGWLGANEVHTMRPEQVPLRPTIETHNGETPGVMPTCWICKQRQRDWAAQARREGRVLTHEAATTPYWQLVGSLAPNVRVWDEAITGLVQKIEGHFLQSRTFTRSRGRRFLEWAAAWLHYYIR